MESLIRKVNEDIYNFKENLAMWISDALTDMGYDGDEIYDNMYWFARGQKVKNDQEIAEKEAIDDLMKIGQQPEIHHMKIPHVPKHMKPLKIYIDSDEYKRREDDKFFKKFDKNRYKIHDDADKSNRTLKFNRLIHKRDKSMMESIKNHAKDINEFWKSHKDVDADAFSFLDISPKKDNEMNMIAFKQWKDNKNKQKQIVENIMENLECNPYNWEINFEVLNNEGRRLLIPKLKEFFEETIAKLPIIQMYKIKFSVGGQWITKPLTPEIFNKLVNNFTEENFVFDIDSPAPEYFYEKGGEELPAWSLFTSLSFSLYEKYEGNNDVGGSFFQYLTKETVPKRVVDYLKKLQIFDSLMNDKGKQRKELDDCCFVYALEQTGCYDKITLDKIRLRIQNRYLSQSSINELCMEFGIHIKLTYIDENDIKNKKKTVRSTCYCSSGHITFVKFGPKLEASKSIDQRD